VASNTKPDWHVMTEHDVEPGNENRPLGQGVQETAARSDTEFVGQGEHVAQPDAELQNVPAGHRVQLDAPGAE
jgi:hypothetical protein